MKTGILNELLNVITTRVAFVDSGMNLSTGSFGDPCKGELLAVKWDVIRDTEMTLAVAFDAECFVDRAVVCFDENTDVSSVTLCKDGKPLYKYAAETGKTVSASAVELEAGLMTESLEIVVEGAFADVEIKNILFYGAIPEKMDVFPVPENISFGDKTIPVSFFDTFSFDCEKFKRAGEIFSEKFMELTGILCKETDNGIVRFICDDSIPEDGFRIDVSDKGAKVYAAALRGAVMGAETLLKLCDGECVCEANVSDTPAYPFRGVHLFLPSEQNMDFAKRLVKYMISPLGYNHIIIEIAGGMQFDSHPEINEAVVYANRMHREGKWPAFPHGGVAGGGYINKDAVRDFVDYIRSFGIDVIPEIQSLGHVQFMTLAHPEIAEIEFEAEELNIDTRDEDARPETFYKHSYCPQNPKSYEILFDLIDEIVEVFKPSKYVHMGHDEVYQIGVCPVCKNKDAAKLYYDDVMKIYNHLSAKGLKMMIWSDMIQPVSNYATRPAIDMLPKDIVMLDFIWYFHLDKDIETNLLNKGYSVAIGNLYSSHYPRFETRIRRKGMIGGQISAWVSTCEESLQREGKLYDFVMTSQMLWSAGYSEKYFLCYDEIIRKMMPVLRDNLRGIKSPSMTRGAEIEIVAVNDITFPPEVYTKSVKEYSLPKAYKSLVFYHTELKKLTRLPWQDYDVTAKYVISYSDGTTEEVNVTNNGNIGYWNRRQNEPLRHPLYRHTGYTGVYYSDGEQTKTVNGENVCIYRYEYVLPKGKTAVKVRLEQSAEFDTEVFLVKLEGVN